MRYRRLSAALAAALLTVALLFATTKPSFTLTVAGLILQQNPSAAPEAADPPDPTPVDDEFAPATLDNPISLPSGDYVQLSPGQQAFESRRDDKTLKELVVKTQTGVEIWHVNFDDDGHTIVKAEEHRPDGTLKRTFEFDGDDMTVVTFYANGTTSYSKLTVNNTSGERSLSLNWPNGSVALEQNFDGKGRVISELVYDRNGDEVLRNTRYEEDATVNVTYAFPDLHDLTVLQYWRSPLGSAEPTLELSWTENQRFVEKVVIFASDGSRVLRVITKNDDGSTFVDTVSPDGQSISYRRHVDADDKLLGEIWYGSNAPRFDIPKRFLAPPPVPMDPLALGIRPPR